MKTWQKSELSEDRVKSQGRLVRFKLKQIHIAAACNTLCGRQTLTTIYGNGRKISWQIRNAKNLLKAISITNAGKGRYFDY